MTSRLSNPNFSVPGLLAPVVSFVLLLGMGLQQAGYKRAEDFDNYHLRAAAAVEQIPRNVGFWSGQEVPVPQPAADLLDPNALRNIEFTDYSPATTARGIRRASLVVVQCRQARDMLGHYPPNCYPHNGNIETGRYDREWTIGERVIPGREYHFVLRRAGQEERRVVYNFMIVPGVGIARDIDGVEDAAEDYQQRYRGAAQVQVVFGPSSAGLSREQRDKIFQTLLEPALPAIRVLADGAPVGVPVQANQQELDERPASAAKRADADQPSAVDSVLDTVLAPVRIDEAY